MSGEKKQSTHFKFGFTQTVRHQRRTVNIGKVNPHFVEESPIFSFSACTQKFKSKAGQVSHATWAHPKTTSTTQPVTPIAAPKNVISVGSDVKRVLNELISSVEREEIKTSKGQGQKSAPK